MISGELVFQFHPFIADSV